MAESGATTQSGSGPAAILGSSGTNYPSSSSGSSGNNLISLRLPNPLHDYTLYNYLFSLSVLDDASFNTASYKSAGAPPPFLARSASMTPDARVVTTAGKYEYFIEDVKINHLVGFHKITGNTNAIGFTFKVVEPYSMGLFFQALQAEAIKKGHVNYLEAPLLLTLEFKGHKNFNEQFQNIPNTTRHFPLKLRVVDMKVSGIGCVYDISAYPANEYALETAKVEFNTAVSIKGKTVEDMLKKDPDKSLELYLKKRSEEQVKDKSREVPDQYEIIFPKDQEIAKSDMGFDMFRKGTPPFPKDNFVYENGVYKRGNVSIDPKISEFRFAQGSSIINAINQVILMSEYGRNALKTVTPDGFIKWWRIEVGMEYITTNTNLPKTGTKPKKFIYRIIPYMVDSTYFLPPNDRRKGTELDKTQVAKEYNYIYSGDNVDIIDFDINFKTGFYTVVAADINKHNEDKEKEGRSSPDVNDKDYEKRRKEGQMDPGAGAVASQGKEAPTQQEVRSAGPENARNGGGGIEDPASLAARQFQEAITSGVDMINTTLTILGDPYYISDSGMGNYHAGEKSKYVNSDDAMNWDNGEIHIILNFKTPVDSRVNDGSGLYNFGNLVTAGMFSGLYRVIKGESSFQRGKFTQTLKVIRLRNQDHPSGDGLPAVPPEENLDEQTAAKYGTKPGSQQTALLAAQDADFN